MKKKKTYNLFMKIRAALRDIYRYSPMRKEVIRRASTVTPDGKEFFCIKCERNWPIQMADVDHEPPLGALDCFLSTDNNKSSSLGAWAYQLFFGEVQVICKICHNKKTSQQRKRTKNG